MPPNQNLLIMDAKTQALDAFASAVGEIAERDEKIKTLQAEIDALKPATKVS